MKTGIRIFSLIICAAVFAGGLNCFAAEEADKQIAQSVYEVAQKYGVTMAQIALAWHYAKGVTAPIIGSTKISQYDDAVKAMDISLTDEDIKALEAHYLPHRVMGAL